MDSTIISGMTIERPLTVDQVAELYGVTRAAVYVWIRDGRLHSRQSGPKHKHGVTWAALRRFDRGLPNHKRRLALH